jgi:hypothetical protein
MDDIRPNEAGLPRMDDFLDPSRNQSQTNFPPELFGVLATKVAELRLIRKIRTNGQFASNK